MNGGAGWCTSCRQSFMFDKFNSAGANGFAKEWASRSEKALSLRFSLKTYCNMFPDKWTTL
eukprot:1464946-Amphidinium_carterae.1